MLKLGETGETTKNLTPKQIKDGSYTKLYGA